MWWYAKRISIKIHQKRLFDYNAPKDIWCFYFFSKKEMAMDYDQRKKNYESLDDNKKQRYNDALSKGNENALGNQFMQQYKQEMNNNQQSNNNSSNFNNSNGTNWQNQQNFDTPTVNKTENQNTSSQNWQNNQNFNQTNQVSPDLDQSKFQQDPWKITVQEWTAQQTWKPDYQANSEARLNEMKWNLDHYFATSPRMFSDRETFNRVFEYNTRESEAQRQLLDSYWKRKEDMDKASQYTSWESIMNWMNNAEITTDQLNLLKDTNPEAYRKRQELQEEEIKKRIVNDIVPPLLEEISQNMVNMMNNLWIQPQEAEDIEWVYNDTMDRTQAWQTMEDANRTVKRIEEVNNKRTAIMNRYASSTWWTVSDALAAARMQKALAPYDTEMQGLQYQYQDYANLFSQKQAAAYQAAQVRQMQASENQRVWQQRLTALGFAADAMSYRTPEQQAQLRLQEQQAKNDMQLLQQSRLNDLNRYNAYATAKMQNQLQQELTDLSVEDEAQLKANLNNALSDYYKNYWDIIQRSQSQAVEDIIAYAKKKWISVAQALTENFIKPLQNKAEYKQKVATDYGMLSKQTIGTINWRSVIMTTNPNWSISYKYIDDPYDTWIASMYSVWDTNYVKLTNGETMTAEEYNKKYWNKVWTVKPYDMVSNSAFELANEYWYTKAWTLWAFMSDPKNQEGQKWWQCAKFVNDYLESIWVWKYFGTEDAQTRASWCNSDTAKVWTIAVFDYNHYTDWKNYGHVWIVVDTDENGFWVLDSNYDTKNPWTIQKRYVRYGSSSCKWFFDPSQPPRTVWTSDKQSALDRLKLQALGNGQINNSDVLSTLEQLTAAEFSEEEISQALNRNMASYLPKEQRSAYEYAYNKFVANDVVKNFQSSIENLLGLSAAVDQANWAWDLASIYMFMRSQDPRSVVRENEFEAAAQTMWVASEVETWFTKLASWQRLTPEQRQNFIKVTTKVLEDKKEAYNIVYNETIRQMKASSIPEAYYPTDWGKELDRIITKINWGDTSWPEDVIADIYSSAMNDNMHWTSGGYSNMSYGGYETSFLDQMINSKL